MSIAHYTIYHPDSARELVDVEATAIVKGTVEAGWPAKVWADSADGNQDPYNFS